MLDTINLTIELAQKVALVGRSGCGKSTLLQLMAGLIRPTSGSIHIDGAAVMRPSPRWNMMFQKPLLFPWMTVRQNVSLGIRIAGELYSSEGRVGELLDLVGLSSLGENRVHQLSGGQQQRVALARSLATRPDLLLLDEPFSALDEITRRNLQADVGQITDELGLTRVIVTHDLEEAISMGDRVIVMSREPGRIIADLDVAELGAGACKQQVRRILSPGSQECDIRMPRGIHSEVASPPLDERILAASR